MKKLLGMALWLITAIAAIHIGLTAMDYDISMNPTVVENLSGLIRPMKLVIGVAGLLSLLMFLMAMFSRSGACMCGCHEKPMA